MTDGGPDFVIAADHRRSLTGAGLNKAVVTMADLKANQHLPSARRLYDIVSVALAQAFGLSTERIDRLAVEIHTGIPSPPGCKCYRVTIERMAPMILTQYGPEDFRYADGSPVLPPGEQPDPGSRVIET